MKLFSYLRWVLPFCYLLAIHPGSLQANVAEDASPVQMNLAVEESPVQANLVVEDHSIQAGHPFWVGVELTMAEGWDTYWVNPGDAGFPTKIDWNLPEGFEAGPLLWPYPEKFTQDALVGYGYTDSVIFLTEITPPQTLSVGEKIPISADVQWLACNQACVPGNAHLEVNLPIGDGIPEKNGEVTTFFAKARELLPKSLSQEQLTVDAQKEEILLNFKPSPGTFGEFDEVVFIPEHKEVIDSGAPQAVEQNASGFVLNIKRAQSGVGAPEELKGVLVFSQKGGGVKHAVQVDSKFSVPKITAGVSDVGVALGLAFLGGIILNVMPCVLPVIALKIFSFIKMAGERRSEILKHGGLFTFGVLVSFWILSGALLALRAFGEEIGWGFQLQDPVFVVIMAGILFLLGLSLFGVFELGTSLISVGSKTTRSKSPYVSSFMSGVLATLVATPCTGPLLGPALGYALTLPTFSALSIFTAMGFGMAFPYLLFSAFPKLVRFLPKPGNWMIVFKQLMGFLMMGTVVWLVWVFGAQTDNMATFVLLAGLLIMAVGAWIFGRWGAPTRKKLTRMIGSSIAALAILFGGGAAVMSAKQVSEMAPAQIAQDGESWGPYSPQRVAQLRSEGKAVFVDFTAKWCLICQANKVTLHSSEVEKAFREHGVVTMTADWTKRDAVISAELEKLGRSGVPVYVLYSADESSPPMILPQTLSTHVMTDYLSKLAQND